MVPLLGGLTEYTIIAEMSIFFLSECKSHAIIKDQTLVVALKG